MNKKVIIGAIIGIATVSLVAAGILRSTGSSSAFGSGNAVAVKTIKVEKGSISTYVSADGKVEEVEKAEIYFDTPLKVNKVFVEEGQRVTKGQKLFELDMDALNSQMDALKTNRAAQQASAGSKALDAEVERAENNLKAAERAYNDAKRTYENNRELYEAGAISKSELDMSEKALIEADSGVSGLQNARIAYNAAVENRNNSRRSALDNIKATDIQIADLEKKISKIAASCISTMDGVVASLGVQEGAFTPSMQPACRIINPDKLQVRAKLKEYDIKGVAPGQSVKITGDAIDKSREITGTVRSISPVAVQNMTNSGNETVVEVIIAVGGAGGTLKPGLNVTCDISTENKPDALLVPMEALTLDKDENNILYVIDEETMTMRRKTVTVGINSDMSVEVLDGVKEGDLVVLDVKPTYRDGLRVKLDQSVK